MADQPEIKIVLTDEEIDEAYLRREYPESFEQTPEDETAELRLRAVMHRLRNAYPEFGAIKPFRDGPAIHTPVEARRATGEVINILCEPGDGGVLTRTARNYLDHLVDNGGRDNPSKIALCQHFYRVLIAADEGHFEPGQCAALWRDLCFHGR